MIRLEHIQKRFGYFSLFDDLSLSLPDKGLFLLTGENGCGKSTLLYLLSGLDEEYKGEYFFQGRDMKLLSEKEKDVLRRKEIGFLFSSGNLLRFLTVEENRTFDLPGNKLELVSLPKNRSVFGLSGGEELLLALSNELSKNKKAYLLDEVTSSLSKDSLALVMDALKKESKDSLVLLATHDQRIMEEGNRLELKNGKIASFTEE
jgi:putative ABC transport system ATP-binding protein